MQGITATFITAFWNCHRVEQSEQCPKGKKYPHSNQARSFDKSPSQQPKTSGFGSPLAFMTSTTDTGFLLLRSNS